MAVVNGPGNLNLAGASLINSTASLTIASNGVVRLSAYSSVTNNGTFTLGCDANGSSSIAAIPSNSSINGIVSVQRYITGGPGFRGYRLLSPSVYATTMGGNNVYSINYPLLNSTFLTGTGGLAGTASARQVTLPYICYRGKYDAGKYRSFTSSNNRGISNISAAPNYTLDVDGRPL